MTPELLGGAVKANLEIKPEAREGLEATTPSAVSNPHWLEAATTF
jgi:hypothetical protein